MKIKNYKNLKLELYKKNVELNLGCNGWSHVATNFDLEYKESSKEIAFRMIKAHGLTESGEYCYRRFNAGLYRLPALSIYMKV